jgi:hypothetical protein
MSSPSVPHSPDSDAEKGIELRDVFARLARGRAPTLSLAALGLVIAAIIYFVASPFIPDTTSMRVAFAFDGYAQGRYPDHSKFEPDDIRAPDVILEALKRQGLSTDEELQSEIRAAVSVEGIIPTNVTKAFDRLRAAGQTVPAYLPDEYLVTLTLPRRLHLDTQQRKALLNGIVVEYRRKFQRTYSAVPMAFGNAFETLHNADYFEYELTLYAEIQNLTDYLNRQVDLAKTFRSSTTNMSFSDLVKQTELFAQIRLNETLGLIRQYGLSHNRSVAMMKMNYYMRTLQEEEQKALSDQKVVLDLLAKAQERSQNVVMGIKSRVAEQRPETTVLDQGLVDSLLANDAYNFLVHKALDAGLEVTGVQAKIAELSERRKNMEAFLNNENVDQSKVVAQVDKSLEGLETAYNELISNVRKTYADFARQQFADAIRVTMPPKAYKYLALAISSGIGAFLGLVLGMGLSLQEIYIGEGRHARAAPKA